MHYPSKWHFKSWALGHGGQASLCLTSLKGFMLQQGVFHFIKTSLLFSKCSWVINTIHTSVKSSSRKAKDTDSPAEVLTQSPLKLMKGFPLTPAGFKLCLKELHHPYNCILSARLLSCFYACPRLKQGEELCGDEQSCISMLQRKQAWRPATNSPDELEFSVE